MGSLAVVGSGIRPTQLTPECRSAIVAADIVLYVVADSVTAATIEGIAVESVDLGRLYAPDQNRRLTYATMVDRVFEEVDAGRHVCVVFYGHPGVFVDPGPEMMRRATSGGVKTIMLPGISAADALYADLGLDPGRDGIQMFSATDFLLRRRDIDDSVPLVLWQMGAIGQERGATEPERKYLGVLAERLAEIYLPGHRIVMYEAARIVGYPPSLDNGTVETLTGMPLTRASTLFIPPARTVDVDAGVAEQLGLVDD
ncbi:MAG: SAM-dependent methyltransferase [Actinomycetia bacterium]|nr:SAM-dependent methyltransferase [Actinomycetes bacterium]